MWIEPVKRISEDGTDYNLVLLDVEGADSTGISVSLVLSLSKIQVFKENNQSHHVLIDLIC